MAGNSSSRIVSLDGIRAVAAGIVFASHNGLEAVIPGGFGVSIFFFLSGYLISTLLRVEYEQTGSIDLRNFYLRRVFRIFPPLYIALFLYAVPPIGHLAPATTVASIATQVGQMTNYLMAFAPQRLIPMTAATWSLAVEEHFYLLFPLALRWMLRRFDYRRITLALLAACTAVLGWRCLLVYAFGVGADYIYVATDTRVDSLLFGCVLAFGLNPTLDAASDRFSPRFWAVAVGLSAVALLFSLLERNPQFRDTFRYSLQGIGLFAIFFAAVRYHRWVIFRWLEWSWVRGLGVISYTFYLLHEKCLQLIAHWLDPGPLVKALAGFVLTVAVSTAIYYSVERPFAKLRRRLHRESAASSPRPVQSEKKLADSAI
jgi:peptidoglycan/LPS O-acetylase OafA/YrhL